MYWVLFSLTTLKATILCSHYPDSQTSWGKKKSQILSSQFPQFLVIHFFTPNALLALLFVRSPLSPPISKFKGLFLGGFESLHFNFPEILSSVGLDMLCLSWLSSLLPSPSAFVSRFSFPLLSLLSSSLCYILSLANHIHLHKYKYH